VSKWKVIGEKRREIEYFSYNYLAIWNKYITFAA